MRVEVCVLSDLLALVSAVIGARTHGCGCVEAFNVVRNITEPGPGGRSRRRRTKRKSLEEEEGEEEMRTRRRRGGVYRREQRDTDKHFTQ